METQPAKKQLRKKERRSRKRKQLFNLNIITRWIQRQALYVRIEQWLKHNSLPGFFKVPLYDVLVFIYQEAQRSSIVTRTNAVAFNFFLSLFPGLIFFITLIPFILPVIFNEAFLSFLPDGQINFTTALIQEMKGFLPDRLEDSMIATAEAFANAPAPGLLSLGFLLSIYFSSNGVITLMHGFEKSYEKTFKRRNVVKRRAVAIFLTVVLALMVVASVVFIIFGNVLFEWLFGFFQIDLVTAIMLQLLRFFTIFTLFYSGISILYRYGAPTHKRINFFNPGSTLATVLSLLSSYLFSLYVNEFDTYHKLYGSLGTIIAFLLWIQMNAFFIIIGFELNTSIAVNRDLKAEREED